MSWPGLADQLKPLLPQKLLSYITPQPRALPADTVSANRTKRKDSIQIEKLNIPAIKEITTSVATTFDSTSDLQSNLIETKADFRRMLKAKINPRTPKVKINSRIIL